MRRRAIDHPLGELAQRLDLAAVAEMLEMAEADEAGRQPGDHGGGLDALAPHGTAGADQTQRSRGRHAQRRHRLGAGKFTDGRAQHRPAVAHAGKRRASAALELHFPGRKTIALRSATGVRPFAQQQRATIPQLPCPVAELMAGIHGGPALGADRAGMAAEGECPVVFFLRVFRRRQSHQRGGIRAARHQDRIGQGGGGDGHAEVGPEFSKRLRQRRPIRLRHGVQVTRRRQD
ncbi:hypothetical protein GALL_478680 [mine drainage metagenome]|uniref:Uncharacterized protein n=1 Tax=mine drainage metagenome TaxID=410659 RepID=A0A1J5PIB1_9ZZZZ